MIYLYNCDVCNKSFEISKPVSECSRSETCFQCDNTLKRIYTVPQIYVYQGGYNQGLGMSMPGRSDALREYNKSYRDQTGSELAHASEVQVKKQESKYDFSTQEKKDIYQRLEAAGVPGEID